MSRIFLCLIMVAFSGALGGCVGSSSDAAVDASPLGPDACPLEMRSTVAEITVMLGRTHLEYFGYGGVSSYYQDLPWAWDPASMTEMRITGHWNATLPTSQRLWMQVEDLGSGTVLGEGNGTSGFTWQPSLEGATPGEFRLKVSVAREPTPVDGVEAGVLLETVKVKAVIDQVRESC